MFTVTAALQGHNLLVEGTPNDDTIELRQLGPQIWVQHSTRANGRTIDSGIDKFMATDIAAILVNGNEGNDVIRSVYPAPRVPVVLAGGQGDDNLDSVRSEATFLGQAGNDNFLDRHSHSLADYQSSIGAVTVNLVTSEAPDDGFGSQDRMRGVTNIIGSQFNDALVGDYRLNRMNGLAGDDFLSGNRGNDTLNGGVGADTLEGDSGNDYLSSGDISDKSANYLAGGVGDDILLGGGGADEIRAGDGNDLIQGGPGDDLLAGDSGDDSIDGGSGIDEVDYSNAIATDNAEDSDGVTIDLMLGKSTGEGLDALSAVEYAEGSRGRDTIIAGPNNLIKGGPGDDKFVVAGKVVDLTKVDPRDTTQLGAILKNNAQVVDLFDEMWDEFRVSYMQERFALTPASQMAMDLSLGNLLQKTVNTNTSDIFLSNPSTGLGLGNPFKGTPFDPETWKPPSGGGIVIGLPKYLDPTGAIASVVKSKWGAATSSFGGNLGNFILGTIQSIGTAVANTANEIGKSIMDFIDLGVDLWKNPLSVERWGRFIGGFGVLLRDVYIRIPAELAVTILGDTIGNLIGNLGGRPLTGDERRVASLVYGQHLDLASIRVLSDGDIAKLFTSQGAGLSLGDAIFFPPPVVGGIKVETSNRVSTINTSETTGADRITTLVHELGHVFQRQRGDSVTGRALGEATRAKAESAGFGREVLNNRTQPTTQPTFLEKPPTDDDLSSAYRVTPTVNTKWNSLGVEQQAAAINTMFSFVEATDAIGDAIASKPTADSTNVTVDIGGKAQSLIFADMNGDGDEDVVSANSASATPGSVTIHLRRTFDVHTNEAVPADTAIVSIKQVPIALSIGDVNHDDKADIVTASASGTITTLLATGDGLTYSAPIVSNTASDVTKIVLTDLNYDGKLDAVTLHSANNMFSIGIGDGKGHFDVPFLGPNQYLVGRNPIDVKVVAFGSGMDAIHVVYTANHDDGTISMVTLDSTATLRTRSTVNVGQGPRSLDIADVTLDGVVDFLVANDISNSFVVIDGSTNIPTTLRMSPAPFAIFARDINADGSTDIVLVDSTSRSATFVLTVAGIAGVMFQNAGTLTLGTSFDMIDFGHWDRNGEIDALFANRGNEHLTLALSHRSELAKKAYAISNIDPALVPVDIGFGESNSVWQEIYSRPLTYAMQFKGPIHGLMDSRYPGWSGFLSLMRQVGLFDSVDRFGGNWPRQTRA